MDSSCCYQCVEYTGVGVGLPTTHKAATSPGRCVMADISLSSLPSLALQPDDLEASVGPFLLSTEFAKDDAEVSSLCLRLSSALSQAFGDGKVDSLSQGNQRHGEERHKMHCPENQKEIQNVTSFVVILP